MPNEQAEGGFHANENDADYLTTVISDEVGKSFDEKETEAITEPIRKSFEPGSRMEAEISDEEKIEIAQKLTDPDLEIGGSTLKTLAEDIKYAYTLTRGEALYDPEADRALLTGALRGMIGERLSTLVPLSQAETILPETIDPETADALIKLMEGSAIVDPRELEFDTLGVKRWQTVNRRRVPIDPPQPNRDWGKGYKAGIMQGATATTLRGNIPKEISMQHENPALSVNVPALGGESVETTKKDQEIQENATDYYAADVIEGYGGGKDKETGGIDYERTTMPDGFLVHSEQTSNQIYGAVETKAYTPEEFRVFVNKAVAENNLAVFVDNADLGPEAVNYNGGMNLGFNMEGEQEMIAIIRDAEAYKKRETTEEEIPQLIPVVLRVLKDVEDDDIRALQDLAASQGLPYLIVQKLPFTAHELEELSKEALRSVADEWVGKGTLKKREQKVLTDYIGLEQ